MAVTRDEIMLALKECYDPEIPVNVVDLGLIYDVRIKPTEVPGLTGEDVDLDMTLTAQGCPAHTMISEQVKNRILAVNGVANATVNVVWTPAWTPERLSEDARKQLGIE